MITKLNNIGKVILSDYTEYDSEKCRNGGCYGFRTNYNRVKNGWAVSYGTTADFEYCPVCGSFNNHYIGDGDIEYSCGEYEVISEETLVKIIDDFKVDEYHYMDMVEKGFISL